MPNSAPTPTSTPVPTPTGSEDQVPQQSSASSASSDTLLAQAYSTPWGKMLKNHFSREPPPYADPTTGLVWDMGLTYIELVKEDIVSLSLRNQKKDAKITELKGEICKQKSDLKDLQTVLTSKNSNLEENSNIIGMLSKHLDTTDTRIEELKAEIEKYKSKANEDENLQKQNKQDKIEHTQKPSLPR